MEGWVGFFVRFPCVSMSHLIHINYSDLITQNLLKLGLGDFHCTITCEIILKYASFLWNSVSTLLEPLNNSWFLSFQICWRTSIDKDNQKKLRFYIIKTIKWDDIKKVIVLIIPINKAMTEHKTKFFGIKIFLKMCRIISYFL